MATYTYNAWETINLPPVSGNTYFRVSRQSLSNPGTATNGIIYDGLILDGLQLKNLNEVVSPYVRTEEITFPVSSVLIQDDEQIPNFFVYYSSNPPGDTWISGTTSYDIINVKYNWSYETDIPFLRSYRPINLLDYRQYLVLSLKDISSPGSENNVSVSLDNRIKDSFSLADGSIWHYLLNLNSLTYNGAFSFAYSYDFDVTRQGMVPGTYSKLSISDDDRTFSYSYNITNTCYKYALYYLNDIGGWDYMLFGGRELQRDDIKRLQYKKEYVSQALDWGRKNYLTQINEKWELNTSYVNDETSRKLQPLFSSNKIILQDLETSKLIPVNITNASVEHKTYRNQGRKLYSYTINIENSQDKFSI